MEALKKSKRKIKYIIVHCSATPEGHDFRAKDIDRWHKSAGFRCIGYNYVIDLNGNVELGRDVDEIGAHCAGYNKNSIGVCYIGGCEEDRVTPKDTRTQAQKDALISLLCALKVIYPDAIILGHNNLTKMKACPCFNAKEEYEHIK